MTDVKTPAKPAKPAKPETPAKPKTPAKEYTHVVMVNNTRVKTKYHYCTIEEAKNADTKYWKVKAKFYTESAAIEAIKNYK